MNVLVLQTWTRETFLRWAEGQDEPYEFDGVQPVAMTRGNNNHALIVRNVLRALDRVLAAPCQALGPETGIATGAGGVRYPDVVVTRTDIDGLARVVEEPIVVFEVSSPGTARTDRIVKVREYASVPSIRRYVMVEASFQGVTVLSRGGADEAWLADALGEADTLLLPEIGATPSVAEIYARIAFAPGPSEQV